MSTEATVQADVGPGDETGIYYITICNLPFGTSWQELKDWTRPVCAVDHVEVFQNSTSGWVRVRGRENFERAWGKSKSTPQAYYDTNKTAGRLNGGVFKGRSIIASDKNRRHSIKIKELATPPQGAPLQTSRYQPTLPTQYALPGTVAMSPQYSAALGQDYLAGYPQASGSRYNNQGIPSPGYTHQVPVTGATATLTTYTTASSRGHYNYNESIARPPAVKLGAVSYYPQYQHDGAQLALPYRGHDEHPGYYPDYSFSSGEPSYRSEYVEMEPRKLCVSPFPQQARADEVKSWVRRKVDKGKIESIEIPKNSNSMYLMGYVLVTFDSVSSANKAIEQFNKARFRSRRVMARPTREGAVVEAPRESSVSHEVSNWTEYKSSETNIPTEPASSRDDNRRRNEKPQQPKSKETRSTGSSKKKSSEKKSSSSSRKTPGSQTDKEPSLKKPSTDKEASVKDERPVIVDGTSHRNDKH
ncbi:hypothetical protein F53441_4872 [Fusarium austroafricanum]|uniref:RRM domain-containing protein n=1 Tax=Fusarium austroafricanum TaxID=2364996 RepID=A0A8H4KL31_9HYPO|nr:hypothetical protein F53441_4872 [Fusarium austroafricanum]